MEYAQLNEVGTEALQVTTHGNVEWDSNNFCTAAQLTRDGKAGQFRVVPLTITEPPAYDAMTQSVMRDGCEKVADQWQYKWRISQLSEEQVNINLAAAAVSFQQDIINATQARLDSFARTRNYDGILSAATYATSNIPKFASEGQYAVTARDQTWAALYVLLEEVHAGITPMPPSFEDIILPALEWPTLT